MNTALLKLATRDRQGVRRWRLKGMPHAVTLMPSQHSHYAAPTLSWPYKELTGPWAGEWVRRAARVDWHRGICRAAARELMTTGEAIKP